MGCFPCDRLPEPETLKYPAALIINTDPHQYAGTHWVGVFANGLTKELFYFDSLYLAINPLIENSLFLQYFPSIRRNSKRYQSPDKETCPQYVICFVHFLAQGLTFENFLKILDSQMNSDLFVKECVNKMIN